MAYDRDKMAIISVPCYTDVAKIWSYVNTDDTVSTIQASGYFDDELRLDLYDSIRATGSDGTVWLRVSQAPPSTVTVVVDNTAVALHTDTVTVSTAELLALATTPKTLVAAPGADKFLQFFGAELVLNYNSVAYTEAGDNMAVKYENASGVAVSDTIESTGFIDQTADTITNAVPVKDAIVAASGAVNKALVLDNIGTNFAAGDSPVDVLISYKVLTANL